MEPKRIIRGKDIRGRSRRDKEEYIDRMTFTPNIEEGYYDYKKEKLVYDFDTDTYKVYDK